MMDDDSGEIDWLNMPRAERIELTKALYKAARYVVQVTGENIEILIDHALGAPQKHGTDYDSNFRKGEIAAAKAMLIHRYLEENHCDLARKTAPDLFQTNPKSAWEQLLERHTVAEGLKIVPFKENMGIVRRAAKLTSTTQALRLGQRFCLELTADAEGYAVAFQGYRGEWYAVPLGTDERRLRVSVKPGPQWLPRDADEQPIPLAEEDDAGASSFVVITSPEKTLPTDQRGLINHARNNDIFVYRADVRFVT